MFEASRVPSGHGFPTTIKNPPPYGMRLAKLSSWATSGFIVWATPRGETKKVTRSLPKGINSDAAESSPREVAHG